MPGLTRFLLIAVAFSAAFARTSAGAQATPIVNNPAPNPNAPSFRVSAQPVMTVGGLQSDPRYELIWSPSDADVTPSGKLLVAPSDGMTAPIEVRVFGTDGKIERVFGRRGEGPGEFRKVSRVWTIAGDSIAVHDDSKQRVSVFDAQGNLGRTIPNVRTGFARGGVGVNTGRCCFDDWSFLAIAQETRPLPSSDKQGPRDTVAWLLGRAGSTEAPRQILRLEDSDPVVRVGTGPGGRGTLSTMVAFDRQASVEITANSIVYGMPDSYEYTVYSRTGTPVRIVRANVPPVPVTSALIATAREWSGRGANDPALLRNAFDRFTMRNTLPAYMYLRAERDGTVWVRGWDGPGTTRQWWARFDPDGKLLGTIVMPENRFVLRFTNGWVLLTYRDSKEGVTMLYAHRIEPISR